MTPRSRLSETAACWACSTVRQKPKRTLFCRRSTTLRGVLASVLGPSEWHRTTTGSLLARSPSGSAGPAKALASWFEETGGLVDSQLLSPAMAHRTHCGAGPRSRHGSSATSPTPFRLLGPSSRLTSWPSSTICSTCGSVGATLLTLHGGRSWQRRFHSAPDGRSADDRLTCMDLSGLTPDRVLCSVCLNLWVHRQRAGQASAAGLWHGTRPQAQTPCVMVIGR